MGTALAQADVRLWCEDRCVGRAKLELVLDDGAPGGVRPIVVDPVFTANTGTGEKIQAWFTDPLEGIAFIGAASAERIGWDC